MKNIKFLLGLLTIVVVMASCATTQGATDDYSMNGQRTEQIGNRLYVQDPYHGTVILERDPFSGRYYDVTYGTRPGAGYYGANPYGPHVVYRTAPRGKSLGRNRGTIIQQGSTQQQIQQNRSEARKKLLGN